MAKAALKVNDFSGGINLYADPRDIEQNEFGESRSVNNETKGKLKLGGGLDGQVFKPTSDDAVTQLGAALNTDLDFDQGYGLLSFNLDTPIYTSLQPLLDDTMADITTNWTHTVANGGSVTQGSGIMQFGHTGSASGTAWTKTDLTSSSIADGDLISIEIHIKNVSGWSPTETGNLKVYFGTGSTVTASDLVFQTGDSNHQWSTNSAGAHTDVIMFVAKWNSTGEYLHMHLDKIVGTAVCLLTVDRVIIKKVPDSSSLNLFAVNGDGSVTRASYITSDDYTTNSKSHSVNDVMGENSLSGAFTDKKVDMSFVDGVVRVSNRGQCAQWTQVDKECQLVSSGVAAHETTNRVRTMQVATYAKKEDLGGLGMVIDQDYEMAFPSFTDGGGTPSGSSELWTPNEGVGSIMHPTLIVYNATGVGADAIDLRGDWDDKGLKIWMADGEAGGTDIDEDMQKIWRIGASLLIDQDQVETRIEWAPGTAIDLTDDTKFPKVGFKINYYQAGFGYSCWDPRVTGFRIWMSADITANTEKTPNPILLAECSFIDNSYTIFGTQHISYPLQRLSKSPSHLGDASFPQLESIPSITFNELHGYYADEELYTSGRTSASLGSIRYIANTKTRGVSRGDRVIRSEPFGFDIFPENNFISVAPNDGDEVICLKSYGSELLVFKRGKLFILNVDTPGDESLEGEWVGMGIMQPSQVCDTDFGVVWINSSGLFLYDGSDVKSLSFNKMPKESLSVDVARDFQPLDESKGLSIGYSVDDKKIIYSFGHTNKNFMVYNASTESFQPMYGTHGAVSPSYDSVNTNFVNINSIHDRTNYLLYGTKYKYNVTGDNVLYLRHYDNDPVDTKDGRDFLYVSKDFTFDNPTTRKRIVGVYITYRVGDTGHKVKPVYSLNSAAPIISRGTYWQESATSFDDTSSFLVDTTTPGLDGTNKAFVNTNGEWETVYLKASSTINCYTFQIGITGKQSFGTVPFDFEVNDITIIYREKSQK